MKMKIQRWRYLGRVITGGEGVKGSQASRLYSRPLKRYNTSAGGVGNEEKGESLKWVSVL
jgi:hypothetical protein